MEEIKDFDASTASVEKRTHKNNFKENAIFFQFYMSELRPHDFDVCIFLVSLK